MKDERILFQRVCSKAYGILPLVRADKDDAKDAGLRKALNLMELPIQPEEIRNLAVLLASAALLLVSTMIIYAFLAGSNLTLALMFFYAVPLAAYFYVERYPFILLESRKAEILGHLPMIASYLVISLRINPILEKAVEFTAENATGPAKRIFRRMVSDIQMGKSTSIVSSLSSFADEWGDIPEYKAFTQLLIASTLESGRKSRWITLEKGMNVLLFGLRDRTDAAARKLEAPILLVFTFLVILPLVFIGLVPALPTVGVDLPLLAVFFLYDIILPLTLFFAISFVTTNKPVTVPPIEMPEEKHKDAYLYAFIAAAAVISLIGVIDLISAFNDGSPSNPFGTSLIILGASFGIGAVLLSRSYGIKRERDLVASQEDEFTETLRQLAVLLSSGRPLPNAMAHITDLSKGRSADIFAKAANNIRLFNIGMNDAFFGEKEGSASKTCSKLIRTSIETIISISDKSSRSIASVIIRLSEHVRSMREIDVEMKKIIGSVTSSMIIIAVFVGPLVGGVATGLGYLLAKTLGEGNLDPSAFSGMGVSTLNPELVKLIIGIYVLETSAILSVFSDELTYGGDKVIKRYHLGMYLPASAFIYSLTVLAIQEVLGRMI